MGLFNCDFRIAADFNLVTNLYKTYNEGIQYISLIVAGFRLGGLSSNISNAQLLEQEVKSIVETNFKNSYYKSREVKNDLFLKKWLELKLFSMETMGSLLKKESIYSVGIFGSGQVANMLAKEFMDSNIRVNFFIDNNEKRQGTIMNGIQIISPLDLEKNTELDAIILGFEGFHEKEVSEQLSAYAFLKTKPIISWRDLISKFD